MIDDRAIDVYRGVRITFQKGRYGAVGLPWTYLSMESLKGYLDTTLDSGTKYVDEHGALMRMER